MIYDDYADRAQFEALLLEIDDALLGYDDPQTGRALPLLLVRRRRCDQ
jgi:hypothetical protein